MEEVAKDLEVYFEGGVEQAGLEARGRGGARGGATRGGARSRIRGSTRGSTRSLVGEEWKELGRQMAAKPRDYRTFANSEGILPKVKSPAYYIEGTVETGTANARGQYRVVCLVDEVRGKLAVTRKYATQTHYGTGSDAGKKPAFQEFR